MSRDAWRKRMFLDALSSNDPPFQSSSPSPLGIPGRYFWVLFLHVFFTFILRHTILKISSQKAKRLLLGTSMTWFLIYLDQKLYNSERGCSWFLRSVVSWPFFLTFPSYILAIFRRIAGKSVGLTPSGPLENVWKNQTFYLHLTPYNTNYMKYDLCNNKKDQNIEKWLVMSFF